MNDFILFISVVLSILTIYFSRLNGARKSGEKQGIILNELENIKQELYDLKKDIEKINFEKTNNEVQLLNLKLTTCEDNLKIIAKKLDSHLIKNH